MTKSGGLTNWRYKLNELYSFSAYTGDYFIFLYATDSTEFWQSSVLFRLL